MACGESHEAPDTEPDSATAATDAGPPSPYGGPCAVDGDCAAGLACLTHFYMDLPECPGESPPYDLPGGYCSITVRYHPGTPLPACPEQDSLPVAVAVCVEPTDVAEIDYCARHCDSDVDCRVPEYFCEPTASVCVPDVRSHP